MSVDHYENFPVASVLLPKALRPAVHAIYRFARSADDIADEGDASAEERLTALHNYEKALQQLQNGQPLSAELAELNPIFMPLAAQIQQHQLSYQPFHDLLSAFCQDVQQSRYTELQELLDYSSRSANPVGRLMLGLYRADNAENLHWSDAICTGLQLTNFWQDVAIDWQKDRAYLPQALMQQYGLPEDFPSQCLHNPDAYLHPAWQQLMQFLVNHARHLLVSGAPLIKQLPGRMALELKLVILGGLRILERLEQVGFDMFHQRPVLAKADWGRLLWRSLQPLPSPTL
ncbi:squalene synthase HpnC [Alcaligenaceae bacterium 429]|uniref:squalene synthase HpnC n=1 Tax=Paenalcaligenes sp. Me52 TaxID=3392038 RepID=UPI001092CA8A|nr:squalene synthase HpnC [Alcaligenaceae bacterium 429]